MTATELLDELARQGFTLTAVGDGIRIRPASRLSEDLRQAVRRHKAELLVMLSARAAPLPSVRPSAPSATPRNAADTLPTGAGPVKNAPAPARCLGCRGPLDGKARCWRCCDRACESCGRPTGSAFLALCLLCECRADWERQGTAGEAPAGACGSGGGGAP